MDNKSEDDFQSRALELRRLDKLARKILGVSETADVTEIKKAWWLLAMKYHPDKNPGDKETLRRFQNIKNAYDYLMNSENGADFRADFDEKNMNSISEPYDTTNNWGYFLWWRDKYF
ncbi:DnaJ domain-containing protein [Candidatus Sumerlaeota bacterium]|nr:DnaJ domain-containing protein [Candidatus Sumerlaeota bacterium]